jgi:hypothetical protein
MKRYVPLFIFSFFFFSSTYNTNSQVVFSKKKGQERFLAATSEPDTNWFKLGFDDSAWAIDTGALGYGFRPIKHKVSSATKSIYVRCAFQISDKSLVKRMSLKVDFDDGYIAYLNGLEVARVNVDKNKKYLAFDDLATRSHQSNLDKSHSISTVPSVYLDSALLASCLVSGNNVMSLHVLNDSTNGSDLSIETEISNLTTSAYNYYNDFFRYKRLIDLNSTNLPLVIIETDQFGIPYNENVRTKVHIGIIDNGPGNLNTPSDIYNVYDGFAALELRGQSSRDFPKQSYRFELMQSDTTDSSVSLLGMPKDNDWILFGPYADKSQIRNKFEYDLGRKLGHWEPRTRFCELILNGQFVGLYYLMENIKREKDRVNIKKLEPKDKSGVAVTGGYILKWDKLSNVPTRFVTYPKEDAIITQQANYIRDYLHKSDSVLASNGFDDPVNGFRKYFGDSSLVDYIIMNEIPKNADSYRFSTYFYKDRDDVDGRIKFGPLWDYDLGFGNTTFQEGNLTEKWQFDYNQYLNITRFLQDTVFVHLLQSRWHELRNGVLSDLKIFGLMDTLIDKVQVQIDRNYIVWPIINETLFYPGYSVSTYDQEKEAFVSWLTARLKWLDENIDKIYYKKVVTNFETAYQNAGVFSCDVFPNPFKENINLKFRLEKQCNIRIEISNLTGQVEFTRMMNMNTGYNEVNISDKRINSFGNGIYLLRVFINNLPVSTQKIIKN